MDLQIVARRCKLPIRLVRYVVDHQILPGSGGVQIKNERGQPRTFTELEAFAIAIATHLLHAGIKRANVVRAIHELTEFKCVLQKGLGDSPLETILSYHKQSKLQLGIDGQLVSISLDKKEAPGSIAESISKVVVIEVDLAAIRKQLFFD